MALEKKAYPILEFDENRTAVIEPSQLVRRMDISPYCVITFFRDVIEKKREEGHLKQIAEIHSETLDIPIYETLVDGQKVNLVLGFLGSAGTAGELEELIALGCERFIVCGGAGVLQKNIAVGHLIVPSAAVRDEGVSYHYLPPSREVACHPEAVNVIEQELKRLKIPYIKGKTWTTDAFCRETRDKADLRISEGCVCVEMEAAAFFAVSAFRGVKLGQILYGGDDLSGADWDSRGWNSHKEIRQNLVELSIKTVLKL